MTEKNYELRITNYEWAWFCARVISLTPSFSWVISGRFFEKNGFNRFFMSLFDLRHIRQNKPLKRFVSSVCHVNTQLKLGVNERIRKLQPMATIKKFLIVHALLSICLLFPTFSTYSMGFKADGEITYYNIEKGNSIPDKHWTFEVKVLGEKWIETSDISTNKGERFFIHGGDGDSVYGLYVDKAAKERLHMKAYVGDVFKGKYPVGSPTLFTTLPWLAYCSSNFFSNAVPNIPFWVPHPSLASWAMPEANIYEGRFNLIPQMGIPMRLEYWYSSKFMEEQRHGNYHTVAGVSDATRKNTIRFFPTKSNIKEPEIIYQVTSLTNYHGFSIPSQFQIEFFSFKKQAGGFKKELTARAEGKLLVLDVIDSIDPLPRLSGDVTNIQVGDYRFADSKKNFSYVGYTATNSVWLTNEYDPFLQRKYIAQSTPEKWPEWSFIFLRFFVFAIVVVALAVPLFLRGIRNKLLLLTGLRKNE